MTLRRLRVGTLWKRAAFTTVELLLALAIAALVAAAAAGMLVSVSYGTSSQRDLRGVAVKGKLLGARLDAAIRGSRAVLETGDDYLVLWSGDLNTNGTADAPDLSEIRLIEREGGDEVQSYQFPDSWTQAQIAAADMAYTMTGNPPGFFKSAADAARTAGSFQPTRWGSGVTAIEFTPDGPDPTVTRLVSYRFTLSAGMLSETAVGAASVRYEPLN